MKLGLVLLLSFLCGFAIARPGEVLPDRFPAFSKQGVIYAAETAEDGSVFIVGDFTEVNGVPRPGIAKLAANGELDPSFRPMEGITANPPLDLLPRDPVDPDLYHYQWRGVELIPLPDGGVIVKFRENWELRSANGRLNFDAMPDLLRTGSGRSVPLIVTGEKLLMLRPIEGGPTRVEAYLSPDFTKDESFQAPLGIKQVTRAGGKKLWGYGQILIAENGTLADLVLLNEDGTIAEIFKGETGLFAGTVRPGRGPGIVIEYLPSSRGSFIPQPNLYRYRLSCFNPGEEPSSTLAIQPPLGNFLRLSAAGSCGEFLYPDYSLQYLYRSIAGVTDPDFKIPLAGPEVTVVGPHETQCVSFQADGKILVGGTRRFLADGTPDPAWTQPRVSRAAVIKGFCSRSNGEILVFGDFDRVDGEAIFGLVTLDQSASLVEGFRPNLDLRSTKRVLERPDGLLLVATEWGTDDIKGLEPSLLLLSESGEFIEKIFLLPEDYDEIGGMIDDFDLTPDGGLVFTLSIPQIYGETMHQIVTEVRYMEAGREDGVSHLIRKTGGRTRPVALSDGRIVVWRIVSIIDQPYWGGLDVPGGFIRAFEEDEEGYVLAQNWSDRMGRLWRVHPDLGVDQNFQTGFLNIPTLVKIVRSRSGKITGLGRSRRLLNRSDSGMIRLFKDGSVDPSFSITLPGFYEAMTYDEIAVGKHLWVGGNFSEIGGKSRAGLAVIDNGDTHGFEEWMEAISFGRKQTGLAWNDDPDQDGFSNFEEYAAGTDSFEASSHPEPKLLDEATWQIPVNPDAQEIERRLEVSDYGEFWREAAEEDSTIEENRHFFRWTLKPGKRAMLSRIWLEQIGMD